jgi:hypothetical protein
MMNPFPWGRSIALLLVLPVCLLPLLLAGPRTFAPVPASRFDDWTTRHVVYSRIGTSAALEAARSDPRAIFRWRELEQQRQLAQGEAQQQKLQSFLLFRFPREPRRLTEKGKRPYKKPGFQHEKVFETMALVCGKLSTTQRQCKFNRRNS